MFYLSNAQSQMETIKKGSFIPLYGAVEAVKINTFEMDVYPVTNADYLEFVKKYPKWQKSVVIKLFADKNYLNEWVSDTIYNVSFKPNSPVTNISWYAAKAYCECQNKRLPTIDEWEYVAMANESQIDARKVKSYNDYILSWYEKPKTNVNEIGSTYKNYWGIYDLHGLVWEWTADFNSIMLGGESRGDGGQDSNLFCGSASIGASDLMNYAAFMRYAMRNSLKANNTSKNLGFRCVK
nr:formylglycine-generating enzyme family protein [Aureibaculum luteum]